MLNSRDVVLACISGSSGDSLLDQIVGANHTGATEQAIRSDFLAITNAINNPSQLITIHP